MTNILFRWENRVCISCFFQLTFSSLLLLGQPAVKTQYAVSFAEREPSAFLVDQPDLWKDAACTVWGPGPYTTEFRALWNNQGLFLRFDAYDRQPWSTMTRRDAHLWEEEVVEIFLDPNGSGQNYAEIEISPANVICDVLMRRAWPNKNSDLSWNFRGLASRVFTFPSSSEPSSGWRAFLSLPWNGFRTLPSIKNVSLPPQPGDQWQFNLFRIKRPGGKSDPEKDVIYAAWSPTGEPSFHVPRAFRPLLFRGKVK